jgi:hypothetical protein
VVWGGGGGGLGGGGGGAGEGVVDIGEELGVGVVFFSVRWKCLVML